MTDKIKHDIDLIEIFFFIKKNISIIIFVMTVCMAMMLLFLCINKDNVKLSYRLKINQTTPGVLINCGTNDNFSCQTTMIEDVIQQTTTLLQVSTDVKNRVIKLEWSGNRKELPTAKEEISRVQASIIKWYELEYRNDKKVLDNIKISSAMNSELYTKMIYLTSNWELCQSCDSCVTISSPEVKNKYPAVFCLILSFFLSVVIVIMFFIVRKMVDEYSLR